MHSFPCESLVPSVDPQESCVPQQNLNETEEVSLPAAVPAQKG